VKSLLSAALGAKSELASGLGAASATFLSVSLAAAGGLMNKLEGFLSVKVVLLLGTSLDDVASPPKTLRPAKGDGPPVDFVSTTLAEAVKPNIYPAGAAVAG
jgi:hypothetical protein